MAKQAVNGWFADLVTSAAKPIFNLLAETVLATPPLDSPDMARAKDLWGVSQTIANTCYVLIITVGGVLLMAGHSLPGGELTPGQLVARLLGAFLASNLSLIVIGYGITFANGLATAFLRAGAEAVDPGRVAKVIAGYVVANLVPAQPFTILIGLGVVVLALCVGFIYIVRVALTMVLIAAAPVALMFHALPATDGLARLWWRSITGVLAIGVCQSLILATAFRLMFSSVKGTNGHFPGLASNSTVDLLLALCLLWVMVRVPSWVARTIWRQAQPRLLTGLVKSLILYRGLGALMNRRAGSVRPWNAPLTPPPPPAPPPQPPSPPPPPPPLLPSRPRLALSGPPLALPAGAIPMPPGEPPAAPAPDPDRQGQGAHEPMQMALPIPAQPIPGSTPRARRPRQLALPIPVTRVPRPSVPSTPTAPVGRARSGQLMLPGMPRRPVPRRQLTLWTEPPKNRAGRRR
jgi:hypothetical protein